MTSLSPQPTPPAIVFLDLDGVLQSSASILAGTPMALSHDMESVQRLAGTQATKLLLRIQNVHAPHIHWYIASSWCNLANGSDLVAAFTALGFTNVHVCESGERISRVREVLKTLPENQAKNAIIIDDSPVFRGTDLELRWVQPEAINGFDGMSYYETLDLLGVEKQEIYLF